MSTVISSPDSAKHAPAAGGRSLPGLAGLGVIALLIGALVAFGLAPTLLPDSYSWTEHGVSESAAQGIDGAWLARMGFISYGLAVLWLVGLRRSDWGPLATVLHLGFGVCMFGVAAFSAKPWEDNVAFVESEDFLHGVFASVMGFGFVAGVVTLIVVRRNRSIRAAVPDWVALVVTATVPLAMSASIWGVLQRAMFITAAAWYGREGWLAGHDPQATSMRPATKTLTG